ncbi:MAG: capsular polysaccharide biosynthesis protein [Clostridia bacterium]|nr:capsular polysaccharide biosynthesis protein [Clostridia bacterium]
MVDFHTHILPNIDDGSQSVQESVQLLNMLREQGVGTVLATPHFLADRESVDDFLKRRSAAYSTLCAELPQDMPRILLGAEVKYYSGISRMEELKRLCIGESKLLLLEMPMSKWTEYTIKELIDLSSSRGITIVLAHIERYMSFQDSGVFDRLLESGILMQVNATFFTSRLTRRRAVSMLRNGYIHFLGSDCHSVKTRPPYIGDAVGVIEKKMGSDFIALMTEYASSQLV